MRSLVLGLIGLAGAMLGWLLDPGAFRHAWLAALAVWLGWPLGSVALLLTHGLTGGRWGEALRPALVAGVSTLPLLLPALVPFVLVAPSLYPWLHHGYAAFNAFYLNLDFALARAAIYLVVWFGLASMTLRAVRIGAPLHRLAPPGLFVLAFTVTFAAIDATMSLDPDFNSSVYGMIAAAGMGLLALAIATLATAAILPDAEIRADLGKLLLGLTVLWAYLDFMQFLIVWESNLAQEARWYVLRSSGGWGAVSLAIGLLHFALPFFALLLPVVRRSRAGVMSVAGLLVAMEIVRGWWLVLPAAPRGLSWVDPFAMLALFGLGAAIAAARPVRLLSHV